MKNKKINSLEFNKIKAFFCLLLLYMAVSFQMQAQKDEDILIIPDSSMLSGALLDIPKATSTISYASVSGEKLLKMPSTNLSNSLFGILPGLTVIQGSGEPGHDAAYLTIRGLGSYNESQPSVYVDGYQVDFSYIQYLSPSEIESISILKDAAALAPFGMKGAHGILWITTKRGIQSKPIIGVDLQVGWQKPTVLSKPLSATEYASFYNEAYSNDLGAWNDYYKIPDDVKSNTDWYDHVLKGSAPFNREDITIKGGSSAIKYFVLLGHAKNNGLYDIKNDDSHSNAKFEQFTLRTNLDFTILKIFEGRVNIGGRIENRSHPNYSTDDLWRNLASYPNIIYDPINGDGSYPGVSIYPDNPYASIHALGLKTMHDRTFMTNFDLKEKLDFILPGLYINQGVSLSTWTRGSRSVTRNYTRLFNGIPQTTDRNTNYEVLDDNGTNQWKRVQLQLGAGFSRNFEKSRIKAAINYLQYIYNIDADLNGEIGLNNNYAFQNIGARIHYDWKNRYAAELGIAYSGSDNYAKNKRFGLYPAVSFAYNVFSNEYPSSSPNINLLRAKISAGITGNDQYNNGRYLYQQYYASIGGGGFATGNDEPKWHNSLGMKYIPNPDVFAEKSTKYNIGVESKFFNKLDLIVDVFLHKHSQIVTPDYSFSAVLGATPPYRNIGEVTNKGFEIASNYTSSVGKFSYSIGLNAAYAVNKIDYMAEYEALSERSARTGKAIGTRFGYEVIGFYDVADFDANGELIASLPKPHLGHVVPGDIKYKDVNGDNMINQFDQIEIGNGFLPKLTYGANISFEYQGFDFGFLFQGIKGRDLDLLYDARLKTIAFENNGNVYKNAKDRWAYYPDKGIDTRASAKYPRLSLLGNNNNYQSSTLWLKKADYLRIRYVELGYNIPAKVIRRMGLNSVRVYFNASNPFTFSSLMSKYDMDPEMPSGYPALKAVTMGFSLKF